jgi:hypothetical protein
MKKLGFILALLFILALAGCAGPGTNPQPYPSGNFNWGSDATCSPGCPPGMSGSW